MGFVLVLFLLILLFGGALRLHYTWYRPWLRKRARKQRKRELHMAAQRYETDDELIDEVLRERGHR